ncbi:type IA DNA topoisomerase [Bacillus sp. AFS040349]|uniref:type IA DNA topoisomerase n=1 Tax=Bacillus sp. AFS040349 TaxID=2033502 RepID=UPI00159BD223|nr:type IA DNA topoisomerase [Bacillus sp. AFS040349]
MGKSLLIAEKPSQAKKIAEAFSYKSQSGYIEILPCDTFKEGALVTNAIGHILQLVDAKTYDPIYEKWDVSTLPVLPNQFKLAVDPSKRQQFNKIKKLVMDPSISEIVNCGDPGMEGQLLVDEILVLLGNKKPVKRLWSTSLTKDAIRKACKTLRNNKDYENIYYSALARQHSDWLLGINATRLISCLIKERGFQLTGSRESSFSCGRVQSPLVALIYRREIEIENFVSHPYWDIYAEFNIEGKTYKGKWFSEGEEHIFDKDTAGAFVEYCIGKGAYIHSIKSEEKAIRPPQLYNLTTLQSEGNKKLGMSPSEILKVAQGLYQRSLISYPRSQPRHVTPEEAKLFPTILENLSKTPEYAALLPAPIKDISGDKRFVDASKTDDHYAIILTEESVDLSSLSKAEKVIYDMIAKSMIAAHYPDATYNTTEIVTVVDERFTFMTRGKQMVDEGWLTVFGKESMESDDEGEDDELVTGLKENEKGIIASIEMKEGKTTSPKRYTLGNLVKLMENCGNALSKEEKMDFKNSELALGTVATRAGIINQIKDNAKYIRVEKNKIYLEPKGRMLIEALKGNQYLTSPITTGRMERYLEKIAKEKVNYKQDYEKFVNRTKDIVKEIVETTIENSKSWNFEDLMKEHQESKVLGPCKVCGEPVIDVGNFYGCTAYAKTKCTFKLPKKYLEKALSPSVIESILTKGTSPLIKGFQSKTKDKKFEAFLEWSPAENRLQCIFPPKKSNK